MVHHPDKTPITSYFSILVLFFAFLCPLCAAEAVDSDNISETGECIPAEPDSELPAFITEAGDGISITAENGTCFSLGDTIKISGTNERTTETWLFLKGTNLPVDGGMLWNPSDMAVTGGTTWNGIWYGTIVENDSSWEFLWDTMGMPLDPGAYTVYAVTTPTAYRDLESEGADFSPLSLTLTEPTLTAVMPHSSYLPGDEILITGTATGSPNQGLYVWILGDNFVYTATETVSADGTFDWAFNSSYLGEGQYTAFVQHPMYNDQFDIALQMNNPTSGQMAIIRPVLDARVMDPLTGNYPPRFIIYGPGSLKYPDTADALESELSTPVIDDSYVRQDFLIGAPWITIDAIADQYIGDTISLSGSTNLPAGTVITISGGIAPTNTSIVYGNATVSDGGGFNNTWTYNFKTIGFVAGNYSLTASSIAPDAEGMAELILLNREPLALSLTRPLTPGWNLISVPVENATIRTDGELNPTVFCYNTTTSEYQDINISSMSTGIGYWVGAYTQANITFTGDALSKFSVGASEGWNMIGSVSMDTPRSSIEANVGSVISVYAYNTEGRIYFTPPTLTPGSGNWVNTAEDCTLTVTATPPPAPQ